MHVSNATQVVYCFIIAGRSRSISCTSDHLSLEILAKPPVNVRRLASFPSLDVG